MGLFWTRKPKPARAAAAAPPDEPAARCPPDYDRLSPYKYRARSRTESAVLKQAEGRKPSEDKKSFLARSTSFLTLSNWVRRSSLSGRPAGDDDAPQHAPSDDDSFASGEHIEYTHSRSQAWLVQPVSMRNTLSTTASFTMDAAEPAAPNRYRTRYEDMLAGRAENLDASKLEKFLHPDDCLEVLGIPKSWIRMVRPAELRERKERALLTREQYLLLI